MILIIYVIALGILLGKTVGGIDLRYLDEQVNPCDDFYQYACGNFKTYYHRPENEDVLDVFTITENELVQKGTEILSSPKDTKDPLALKKAKAAYKACVDVPEYNLDYYDFPEKDILKEYGVEPLTNRSITNSEKLSLSKIGDISAKFGIHHLFEFVIRNFNPEHYVILMFPDSEEEPQMIRARSVKTYDEVLEESFKNIAKPKARSRILSEDDPFDVFIRNMFNHFSGKFNLPLRSGSEMYLESIKTFAVQLFAGGIIDDDAVLPSDVTTLGELQKWSDETFGDEIDINWVGYFETIFKPSGIKVDEDFEVYILDTDKIYGILNLLRQTEPSIVTNFVLLRTLMYMAPDGSSEARKYFEEYYKGLGLQYYERSEYCTRKILDVVDSASLSFAVAHDFINYHFNYNKIRQAVGIIKNVTDAFKQTVLTQTWIDTESQKSILQKLNNIEVYLGYPDFLDYTNSSKLDSFYDSLEICQWDNYGNAQRIRAFRQAYTLTQYVNHEFWGKSPFDVNAYTTQASNRIMVPFSILQSSYLDGNDVIFDYSRFGSIVAHEYVHHFDSAGIGYDEDASQNKLLTNSTQEEFLKKAQCFIDQYNNYFIEEIGLNVSGKTTVNENMADNGGLRHAWTAFKSITDDFISPSKKFSLDQLFFISYSTLWCGEESDEYLTNLIKKNEHPPSRFRIIGPLSNMQEFSTAFNCPLGSKMNPENKCAMW